MCRRESSGGRSSFSRKLCCALCTCFACVLLAIVIFVVVVAATYEDVEVLVMYYNVTDITVNSTAVSMFVNISAHISNTNRWPIKGSLKQLRASVYSLDSLDLHGERLALGDVALAEPVGFEPESETNFRMLATLSLDPSDPSAKKVAERFDRDCAATGARETKFDVKLDHIVAKVAGIKIPVEDLDVDNQVVLWCRDAALSSPGPV